MLSISNGFQGTGLWTGVKTDLVILFKTHQHLHPACLPKDKRGIWEQKARKSISKDVSISACEESLTCLSVSIDGGRTSAALSQALHQAQDEIRLTA